MATPLTAAPAPIADVPAGAGRALLDNYWLPAGWLLAGAVVVAYVRRRRRGTAAAGDDFVPMTLGAYSFRK